MNSNIVVAGVGGQGSILASHIIAEAAIKASSESTGELNVRVGETFGAAMRGGAVSSHVRIGKVYGPLIGVGEADLVVAIEPLEGLRVGIKSLKKGGLAILNSEPLYPVDVKTGAAKYPSLDEINETFAKLGSRVVILNAEKLAIEAGHAKTISVVMLGAAFASGLLPFTEANIIEAITDRVPQKTLEANLKAFRLGKEAFLNA